MNRATALWERWERLRPLLRAPKPWTALLYLTLSVTTIAAVVELATQKNGGAARIFGVSMVTIVGVARIFGSFFVHVIGRLQKYRMGFWDEKMAAWGWRALRDANVFAFGLVWGAYTLDSRESHSAIFLASTLTAIATGALAVKKMRIVVLESTDAAPESKPTFKPAGASFATSATHPLPSRIRPKRDQSTTFVLPPNWATEFRCSAR